MKTGENKNLTKQVISVFQKSRNNYGALKIKKELNKIGIIVAKYKVRQIMVKNQLFSTYKTTKKYQHPKQFANQNIVANLLKQNFKNKAYNEVFVSDVTDVKLVKNELIYVSLLIYLIAKSLEEALVLTKTLNLYMQHLPVLKDHSTKYKYFTKIAEVNLIIIS